MPQSSHETGPAPRAPARVSHCGGRSGIAWLSVRCAPETHTLIYYSSCQRKACLASEVGEGVPACTGREVSSETPRGCVLEADLIPSWSGPCWEQQNDPTAFHMAEFKSHTWA